MKETKSKIELEIDGEKKTFEMVLKNTIELRDLEEKYLVIINSKSGKQYTGIFLRCDDDDEVIIELLESKKCVGLDLLWISNFLQGPVINC